MQLRTGGDGRGLMRLAFRSELSGEVALNSNEAGRMFSQITRPIGRPRMGERWGAGRDEEQKNNQHRNAARIRPRLY